MTFRLWRCLVFGQGKFLVFGFYRGWHDLWTAQLGIIMMLEPARAPEKAAVVSSRNIPTRTNKRMSPVIFGARRHQTIGDWHKQDESYIWNSSNNVWSFQKTALRSHYSRMVRLLSQPLIIDDATPILDSVLFFYSFKQIPFFTLFLFNEHNFKVKG